MSTKLYVGNLSYSVLETDLEELFAQYGPVVEAHLIQDRMSGRPRGFAFVTMANKEDADSATEALNGKEWQGRPLTVNEARPREERPPGGGGGFRGGKGGGGRDRGRRY